MGKRKLLDQCPNCDAMWGIEEMSFEECDCCGYPRHDEDEREEWDNDFDDDWFGTYNY